MFVNWKSLQPATKESLPGALAVVSVRMRPPGPRRFLDLDARQAGELSVVLADYEPPPIPVSLVFNKQ